MTEIPIAETYELYRKILREELTSGDAAITELTNAILKAIRDRLPTTPTAAGNLKVAVAEDNLGLSTEATLSAVRDKLERLRTVLGDNLTTYTTTSNTKDTRALLFDLYDRVYNIEPRFSAPGNADIYTTTPLDANATYYSPAIDFWTSRLGHAGCVGFADQPSATDGVQAQLSIDGSNWDYVAAKTTASANVGVSLSAEVRARYLRFVWTNGATAQTVFRFGGRYYI